VDAHSNLAKAYNDLARYQEGEISARRALSMASNHACAWVNLANALCCQGKLAEAEASAQKAIEYGPQMVEGYLQLGTVYCDQGRTREAVACFDQALRLRPEHPKAHWGRAMAFLLAGDFERGWPEYEWRPKFRKFAQPAWDGGPLAGKSILLYAEWGLGDTIQFIRYATLVKERGAMVIVACAERLIPLLRSYTGINQLVPDSNDLPPFDVHASLLNLPMLFGTTLGTIPASTPYLSPDPRLVEQWGRELQSIPGFKVGIAWQGNPQYRVDALRSIPLAEFAPLAMAGVSLISLQKGGSSGQPEKQVSIVDWSERLDTTTGAFMDTAAIMKSIDLVISADSAVAHLAGALGLPVWVALPFSPDCRWMLARDDSPWYPTMRLFRQDAPCQWGPVFERMARELHF
jgi:hypothetical protein